MNHLPDFLGQKDSDNSFNWPTRWGSRLIHQKIAPKLKPGDKVLDVCAGWGRASICFSLKGCDVTLFDKDADALRLARECSQKAGYEVNTVEADLNLLTTIFPQTRFAAVILSESTVHLLKSQAHLVLANACGLLAPGGFIYVDAPCSEDWHYQFFSEYNEQVDDDTFLDFCSCSGEEKMEPFCFYHPGELGIHLNYHGLRLIHQDNSFVEREATKTVAIAQLD